MTTKQNAEALTVEVRADGVAVMILDVPGKPVNTLSMELLDELERKVEPLLSRDDVRALVIASGKPGGFIAGADLGMLSEVETAEQAAEISRRGNELLSRIAASPRPIVAAVHGPALGGGLEVALACRYILATDDPATQLGLPEVTLGLLPAGGGTQRLVARVGLTAALPLLLTGKKVRARKALELGLVDALTTPGGLVETACRAASALADGKLARREPDRKRRVADALTGVGPARAVIIEKARKDVLRKTRGLYPAPLAILDCVETGLADGEAAGLAREAELFGKLVVSSEARALCWIFDAMTARKKPPRPSAEAEPRPVGRLGVLGSGFMGAGIAAASLPLCPVTIRDISGKALARGADTIRKGLKARVKSGAISRVEGDRLWSRAWLTTDIADLRGSDLVIEAVFEDLELKRKVLAEAEDVLAPEAVFASNTSALPIAEIAAEARHPERVLGMHYFSPVHRMPLVELVVADRTAPWAVATAHAFAAAQGKSVIVVKDGPGFYTTRVLAPYLDEAVRLLEEGVTIESIDEALADFGFPVGPITLLDEVGVDVGAHVARDLGAAFAERSGEPSDLLERMVEAGMKGRKSRQGFYRYPEGRGKKARKRPNEEVYRLVGADERREVHPREIQERVAFRMINEAAHCLGDEVIASPSDGDIGAVLGIGFPPFRGGPFHYSDALGLETVLSILEGLTDRHGQRFEPAPIITEMARKGHRYFG